MNAPAAAAHPAYCRKADFARILDCGKSYVTKLDREGRLVLDGDGLVDVRASLERIKATTGAPERAAPPVQGKPYSDAQDRERFYSAELRRIEYEKAVGKLLEADAVDSALHDAAATFRAAVESWWANLPPQLAAMGADEKRAAALLRHEGEQLLKRVAARFAALAHAEEAAR